MTQATMSNGLLLQAWRLEYNDADSNHFKQYTVFCGQGYVFFGFGRIGGVWQWSVKESSDPGGAAQSQLMNKRRSGYQDVWKGDVRLPEVWCYDPKGFGRLIQDVVEAMVREGRTSPGTPVASEEFSPLGDVLDAARDLVTKMAVNPDSAVADFARLVAVHETAREELDTVESYIETLKIMIGGAA